MGLTYDGLFQWLCDGEADKFYESFLWPGWEKETSGIGLNQGIAFYPLLWADCESMEARERKIVPIDEIIGINFALLSQIEKGDDINRE